MPMSDWSQSRRVRSARPVEGEGAAMLREHVAQLESKLKTLTESFDVADRYIQPWERYMDGGRILFPSGFPTDRKAGRDWPIIATEMDLRQARAFCRLIGQTNPLVIAFLDHVTNFVVKTGFKWSVQLRGAKKSRPGGDIDPDVKACQSVLDEFRQLAGWGDDFGFTIGEFDDDDYSPQVNLEHEGWRRAMRDGEFFLRLFRGGAETNGVPTCRVVEPECVQAPNGDTQDDWSWGILTADGDVQRRRAFYVLPKDGVTEGESVPAGRVLQLKLNVDGDIKRGIPDFWPLQDEVQNAQKLWRNTLEVNAILAAIAYIRQHAPGVTGTQVNTMLAQRSTDGTSINRAGGYPYYANDRGTDRTNLYTKSEAGQVIDISNQMQYVPGPSATGTPGQISALQAIFRIVGIRWGCPEYFSGDSSNANFASTLVSGGPFEVACVMRQGHYKRFQGELAKRVLILACESGRLRRDQVAKMEITITPPAVAIANKAEDTQRRSQLAQGAGLSKTTWLMEEGYDAETEAANRLAEATADAAQQQPPGAGGAPVPAGGDGGPTPSPLTNGPDAGGGDVDLSTLLGESRRLREERGPPPYEGAVWKDSTKRWTHPKTGVEHEPAAVKTDVVGSGNTGDVIRDGNEVVKRTILADGTVTKEGEFYHELSGVVGVAPGRKDGDTVRLPHYQEVLSIDTVPNESDRKGMGSVVGENKGRLLNAANAMSEKGIDYNDPLQVGFDDDFKAHVIDLSNAGRVGPKDALRSNIERTARFLHDFGAEGAADDIRRTFSVYNQSALLSGGDAASAVKRMQAMAAKGNRTAQAIVSIGPDKVAGYDVKYAYYTGNPRPVGRDGILQSEPDADGLKIILSDKPMDDDTIRQYGLTAVVHPSQSVKKSESRRRVSESRLRLLHEIDPPDGFLPNGTAFYFEDRSGLVKKVITNKLGKSQTIYVRPNTDAAADADKTVQAQADSRTAVATAVGQLDRLTMSQFHRLDSHIAALSRDEIRGHLKALGEKIGGAKVDLATRLLAKVRAEHGKTEPAMAARPEPVAAAAMPTVTVDEKPSRTGRKVTFRIDDDSRMEAFVGDGYVKVSDVQVSPAERGKGWGSLLYGKALQYAADNGMELRSDNAVSPSAAAVWDRLKRSGVDVVTSPKAVKKGGMMVNPDGGPVFSVPSKKNTASPDSEQLPLAIPADGANITGVGSQPAAPEPETNPMTALTPLQVLSASLLKPEVVATKRKNLTTLIDPDSPMRAEYTAEVEAMEKRLADEAPIRAERDRLNAILNAKKIIPNAYKTGEFKRKTPTGQWVPISKAEVEKILRGEQ